MLQLISLAKESLERLDLSNLVTLELNTLGDEERFGLFPFGGNPIEMGRS